MIRLFVPGASGMLGHQLLSLARRDARFDVWFGLRSQAALALFPRALHTRAIFCDVTKEEEVAQAMDGGFDAVINCAGITKAIANDPVPTIRANSLAPHLLATHASSRGARLIHVSTDCVFSGQKGSYREDDIPDPVDLYGRSKLLGEVTGNGHLTIRTSFIGHELAAHYGLLDWFLGQSGEIRGYARALWSGFTSLALSRILLELALRPDAVGLLNVAGEHIDKYTLLCKLRRAFAKEDVSIVPSAEPFCDRTLDNSRFQALGIDFPSMDNMIAELAASYE